MSRVLTRAWRRVPPPVASPAPLLAAAAAVAALAAAFLDWASPSSRPDTAGLVALGLVAVGSVLVLAGVARSSGPAIVASVVALVVLVSPGLRSWGGLWAGDGREPAGPALGLAAAVVLLVAGVAAHRAADPVPWRWRPVAHAGVALAVLGAVGGVRLASAGSPSPAPRRGDVSPGALRRDPVNEGLARPVLAPAGRLRAAVGERVLVDTGERAALVDTATGRTVWSAQALAGHRPVFVTADGAGVVGNPGGGVARWNVADGDVVWTGKLLADGPAVRLGADRMAVTYPEGSGAEARSRIVVADVATGRSTQDWDAPCKGDLLPVDDAVVLRCRVDDDRVDVVVYGADGGEPVWRGTVAATAPVAVPGPGVVVVGDPAQARPVVDAAAGTVRFTLPAGGRVVPGPDRDAVVVLTPDRVLETRDRAGTVTARVPLADGPEHDPLLTDDATLLVADGRLLAVPRDGAGPTGSASGPRRLAVVGWDVASGRRVERSLTGPAVVGPVVDGTEDAVTLAGGFLGVAVRGGGSVVFRLAPA